VAREIGTQAKGSGKWRRVAEPKEFDVVVMAARVGSERLGTHVGVMVGADRVFHTEQTGGAVAVKIDHNTVKQRLLGFYRLGDLA